MTHPLVEALFDIVTTLSSRKKKYGGSTRSALDGIGRELAEQVSSIAKSGEKRSLNQVFERAAEQMDTLKVPRYGVIAVGASMYKRLRALGLDHGGAQTVVDMWDLRMDHIV